MGILRTNVRHQLQRPAADASPADPPPVPAHTRSISGCRNEGDDEDLLNRRAPGRRVCRCLHRGATTRYWTVQPEGELSLCSEDRVADGEVEFTTPSCLRCCNIHLPMPHGMRALATNAAPQPRIIPTIGNGECRCRRCRRHEYHHRLVLASTTLLAPSVFATAANTFFVPLILTTAPRFPAVAPSDRDRRPLRRRSVSGAAADHSEYKHCRSAADGASVEGIFKSLTYPSELLPSRALV